MNGPYAPGAWPLTLGTSRRRGDSCFTLVRDAIAAGYRYVDTAQIYKNEADIGRALHSTPVPRDQLHITTKLHLSKLSAEAIPRAIERSLVDLGTDYIDLVLIHWPSPDVPLSETLPSLLDQKRRGNIRYVGLSNFTSRFLVEAVGLSDELVCNQVEFHPYLQQPILSTCTFEHGLQLAASRPLAGGRILEERIVKDIAARHRKAPNQVVLRWNTQHRGVCAIVGSSTTAQLVSNLDIADFELSEAEMSAISALDKGLRTLQRPHAPVWDDLG